MADFLVVAIILVIVGAAILFIRKEKKRGVKCVGCPFSEGCSGHCNGDHSDIK